MTIFDCNPLGLYLCKYYNERDSFDGSSQLEAISALNLSKNELHSRLTQDSQTHFLQFTFFDSDTIKMHICRVVTERAFLFITLTGGASSQDF